MIVPQETVATPPKQWSPEILALIKKTVPRMIAEEIVNVQPMDEAADAHRELYRHLEETGATYVLTSNKE